MGIDFYYHLLNYVFAVSNPGVVHIRLFPRGRPYSIISQGWDIFDYYSAHHVTFLNQSVLVEKKTKKKKKKNNNNNNNNNI